MLRGYTSDNQRLIVARTQKSNHPSLAVGNKLKLQVQLQSWMHMCDESAAFTVMWIHRALSVPETFWLSVGVHRRAGH